MFYAIDEYVVRNKTILIATLLRDIMQRDNERKENG